MKTKVLILGAGGAIARHVISALQKNSDIVLTLFARNAEQLHVESSAKIIEGDVLNKEDIGTAVKGQDIVYANLSGPVDQMARSIVATMNTHGVRRLIFVTALGIYNEVTGEFGEWNNRMIGAELVRYRKAADVIENSDLDYTIVRPSWLTNKDETDYETTQKGEAFRGTEVARKAVGTYIAAIILHPGKDVKASVGVNKPGIYGDKPAFY
ncbi:SDR family oxidoreductase [Niabella pedocola]|uniref:SDR family oxidoreductase n=1 Tax=Niabella pedocola TaxID=1752077 RepID=A0ABS8PQ70_9BACT|nr:SDR family oxidoreductase [Niabella pedocola]MCD2423237.1 SDR family oxidoreductase [Niabella pedocola]